MPRPATSPYWLLPLGLASLPHLLLACDTTNRDPGPRDAGGNAGSAAGGGSPTLDPGRKVPHRLSSNEYNASIQDVLGTTLEPANGNWRGGELGGFDNIASVLGVDEAQYNRYFEAAKALAAEATASEELRKRFGHCQVGEATCARSTIAQAGLHLFRRPLDADELATYQRVYDAARALGDEDDAALELVVQALLSSAEFLYRIELDARPESTEAHPLDAFELATRLSYFLWSSVPDDALLQSAADGSLLRPTVLDATVDRMLDDAKSQRFATSFAEQWLGARQVLSHPVAEKFYRWSPPLAQAASREIVLYFSDFLQSGRSFFELATADFNYVDGPLAYFYGIPATVTEVGTFERVEYHDDHRAGFFGLAGFLAVSSFDRRTSPSKRGHFIAGNLLCAEPPPPPPNVPSLPGDAAGAAGDAPEPDLRQRLEEHRQNPACAACHAQFDPYGLALEEYDAIGAYRATYEDGTPIDTRVTLPGSDTDPAGLSVTGLDGLSQAIGQDPRFGACLAKKLFSYGLGRLPTAADDPHLQLAQQEWLEAGQTPSIRRLLHALISSQAFRFRRGGE